MVDKGPYLLYSILKNIEIDRKKDIRSVKRKKERRVHWNPIIQVHDTYSHDEYER